AFVNEAIACSNRSPARSSWPRRKSVSACDRSTSDASGCALSVSARTAARISGIKKGAARRRPPILRPARAGRYESDRLELEPRADAERERRLVLRRRSAEERVHRLAEVGVRRAGVQLRVLIVARDALLVEQVEHVRHERQAAVAVQLERPRGFEVHLALERRALHE